MHRVSQMTWNNGEVIAEKRRYILDDIFRRQLVDNKETPDLGGEGGGDKGAKEKRDWDNFMWFRFSAILKDCWNA